MPNEESGYNRDYCELQLLPPPPDVRRVILSQEPQLRCTQEVGDNAAKEVISSGNTTIIGDYIAAAFDKYDAKWLVQVVGNVTIQSIVQGIHNNALWTLWLIDVTSLW